MKIEDIKKACADYFNITVEEMESRDKTKKAAVPRHYAIFLIKKNTDLTLNEIGGLFGGRKHSTVLSSYYFVSDKLESRFLAAETKRKLDEIKALIPPEPVKAAGDIYSGYTVSYSDIYQIQNACA
mgnify:CR=1 FL=1